MSDLPADVEFDYLATKLIEAGWEDVWIGYDHDTRVYLVVAKSSGIVVEGAIHTSLLYTAASGLAHDLSHKLKAELAERDDGDRVG